MANELTGRMDALVQLAVPVVNRLLAAQHQGGVYLHSFRARIEDSDTEIEGIASVQSSTPTLSLPEGAAGNTVRVSYEVMAQLTPPPAGDALPEFVHGTVEAAVVPEQIVAEDLVSVNFDSNELEVTFTPADGAPLSGSQVTAATQVIRNFLRTGLDPVTAGVLLTEDADALRVRHWRFRTLTEGAAQSVAVLLSFQEAAPAQEDVESVTTVLLNEGDHCVIAIGRDFLENDLADVIRSALRSLRNRRVEITIKDIFGLTSETLVFQVSVDGESLTVRLRDERIVIEVAGRVRGVVDSDFVARQAFSISVNGDGQLSVEADGDFDLDFSSKVLDVASAFLQRQINRARDAMVDDIERPLRQIPTQLGAILRSLSVPHVEIRFTSAEISASEGIVLRGTLDPGAWDDPVATFTQTIKPPDAESPLYRIEFDAHQSWIPGGTVRRYRWMFGNEEGAPEIIEEHKFVTRFEQDFNPLQVDIRGLRQPRRWCLEVSGTQGLLPSGAAREVRAGSCGIGAPRLPEPALEAGLVPPTGVEVVEPSGRALALVDLWDPRPDPTKARGAGGIYRGSSLVVHFAGPAPESDLSAILNSVAKRQRKASSVLVVGILREPKAAAAKVEGSDANMAWAQTTDPDGSWARAFPASKQPATFLIDPAGKVVWSHSGPVMGSSLADAIDKYLATGGPLRWQQLRPLAREGGPAPDFIFELEKGRVVPLRALRGASVVLVFWQSRLPYCLEELVHWERTARAGAGRGARILAISDGEDPQRAREVFKKGGFSSRLVCDPERRIGLAYGVRCWPTAIAIDRSGRVKRVQVGTTPRLDPATSTRSAP